jgi:uncharacterized protein involved in response to NO
VGISYALRLLIGSRRNAFRERKDTIPYVFLPAVAYALLILGCAILSWLPASPQSGLTVIATGMITLIALALRNSWSIAVSVVSGDPPTD